MKKASPVSGGVVCVVLTPLDRVAVRADSVFATAVLLQSGYSY